MKILVSGYHNPHYATVTEYIERAVRGLGHELTVFDDRGHVFPGRLRKRWRVLQALSVEVINRDLVRRARKTSPDLILVTGGHRVTARALGRLKHGGFRTALWTTDMPGPFDRMRTTAAEYDFVFSQGTEYVDLFKALGIASARWLPMGCDPDIHRRTHLRKEEAREVGRAVVFVGSFYPWRADLLKELTSFDLAVWGPGWDRLPLDSPLRPFVKGLHTPPEKWVKIYSGCDIAVSAHVRDPQQRIQVHQASPRVFESLACGAFLLTDRQRDVLSLFRDGEHLATFADPADLKRKVTYYLEHPHERCQIAAAGRAETLQRHTYAHRINTMLAVVRAHGRSCSAPLSNTAGRGAAA